MPRINQLRENDIHGTRTKNAHTLSNAGPDGSEILLFSNIGDMMPVQWSYVYVMYSCG